MGPRGTRGVESKTTEKPQQPPRHYSSSKLSSKETDQEKGGSRIVVVGQYQQQHVIGTAAAAAAANAIWHGRGNSQKTSGSKNETRKKHKLNIEITHDDQSGVDRRTRWGKNFNSLESWDESNRIESNRIRNIEK